ncbi:DUF4238 domain-containing protein [Pseudoxanthomonas winnipegensis]|uniref:DUF4238 domain-containing protein n=1 Tax=Pseudoxanthomonas winnipegensis TaxID=2480810 RepID=UPI0030F47CB4
MAGRRQHYLPRFLQRPFRYRSDKQDYVHAHESTRSYTPSTMGLGQERDFYGGPEESLADERITASETQLAEILNGLNSAYPGASQAEMALLVAALAVRTKRMREALGGLVKIVAAEMEQSFQTHNFMRSEVESYWTDKKKLEGMIREALKKAPPMSREARSRVTANFKRQWNQDRERIASELQARARVLAAHFFSRLDSESAKVAEGAFRKIFDGDPTVPKRVASLSELYDFTLIEAPEHEEFILGDCAAVGFRSDRAPRLPIGDLNDEAHLEQIYLPISPTKCIAAVLKGSNAWAQVADINEASAALCHRFFISKCAEPGNLTRLRNLIGSAEPLASEEDIQSLMRRTYGDP